MKQKRKKVCRVIFLILMGWAGLFRGQAQSLAPEMDSTVWQASLKYTYPSPFKRVFLGSNYRKEWKEKVKLPVFHLRKMGFSIKELGGGQQTTSLQLRDAAGKSWALRSVDKDVSKAVPQGLRNSPVQNLVQDLISTAHPYIPLVIPTLSRALGIIAPSPTIYFVPDDPSFGQYRKLFANTVCLLEEREPTPDGGDTKSTEKLFEKLFESNTIFIDQESVLRARLLDMLVGDWDRHADQWRWGVRDSGKLSRYYAIPRDRDQAFFYSNGLLPKLAQVLVMRHLVSFDDDLSKLRSLNYKMWPFDRFFLNGLDRTVWERVLKQMEARLSDSLLHSAMLKLPPEIYAIRGERLEKKLRERRGDLVKEGLKYYRFLSGKVSVYGTSGDELFLVKGEGDRVTVSVFDYTAGRQGRLLYERTFIPEDTFAIELWGQKGQDRFVVEESVQGKIQLNLAGEAGVDSYDIRGGWKTWVVDKGSEGNTVLGRHHTKVTLR